MLCGVSIGVACLPRAFSGHPVLWATLAHETGGHDVLNADKGLLPELAEGVRALFGGGPLRARQEPNLYQLQGLLWSYWIEEAAADVYGLLNIGPSFILNTAALLATVNKCLSKTVLSLCTKTRRIQKGPALGARGNNLALDDHPTEILRLHLAIGAIEALTGLSEERCRDYIRSIEAVSRWYGGTDFRVALEGNVPIERDRWIQIKGTWPLNDMQAAARKVGTYIVTTRLKTLGDHNVQQVETWDDADEDVARDIKDKLIGDDSVVDMGDDAQLLAGATLALFERPDLYDQVTGLLAAALDESFTHDPVWGTSHMRHPEWMPH
jgi:hypothetical protein